MRPTPQQALDHYREYGRDCEVLPLGGYPGWSYYIEPWYTSCFDGGPWEDAPSSDSPPEDLMSWAQHDGTERIAVMLNKDGHHVESMHYFNAADLDIELGVSVYLLHDQQQESMNDNIKKIIAAVERHLGDVVTNPDDANEVWENAWALACDAAQELGVDEKVAKAALRHIGITAPTDGASSPNGRTSHDKCGKCGSTYIRYIRGGKYLCCKCNHSASYRRGQQESQMKKDYRIDRGAPGTALEQHADLMTQDELEKFIAGGMELPRRRKHGNPVNLKSKAKWDMKESDDNGPIEAYGVKGMKSTSWRKTFNSR